MKKKTAVTTGLAVLLGVGVLAGGASYAYLKDSTKNVVNNFATNNVNVTLTETTEGYSIIPGTTQDKDPVVTVDSTIPAYVFATVKDDTQGLVSYNIADGWTQVPGFPNVYYRVYNPSTDTTTSWPVLLNSQVSYSSDITNEDVAGKENLNLTFQGYAIQEEGFNTPEAAWLALQGINSDNSTTVTNSDELNAALNNANTSNQTILVQPGDYTLNGSYIRANNLTVIGTGDGVNINVGSSTAPGNSQSAIYNQGVGNVFRNLNITNGTDASCTLIKTSGSTANNNPTLSLYDCTITNNAAKTAIDFFNATGSLNNCTVNQPTKQMYPAITATQSTVTVQNSTVNTGAYTTAQYGFNFGSGDSYDMNKPGSLYLVNVNGKGGSTPVVSITSARKAAPGTDQADKVYWDGNLITNGVDGFSVTYTSLAGSVYTKSLS